MSWWAWFGIAVAAVLVVVAIHDLTQ